MIAAVIRPSFVSLIATSRILAVWALLYVARTYQFTDSRLRNSASSASLGKFVPSDKLRIPPDAVTIFFEISSHYLHPWPT
jgi:hypothetical protein